MGFVSDGGCAVRVHELHARWVTRQDIKSRECVDQPEGADAAVAGEKQAVNFGSKRFARLSTQRGVVAPK